MKKLIPFCCAALVSLGPITEANTSIRNWEYANGEGFKAMITDWDSESDTVTLSNDSGKLTKIKRSELSVSDQAYVRQWFNYRKKLDEKLAEAGGTMEFLQSTGSRQIDYYVYKPSTYKDDGSSPLLILFSSSGTGYRMMLRHFEAAEKLGIALVTMDYFSNKTMGSASDEYFEEFLPQLESISHDPKKIFLGGDSGGALRAYIYSGQFDRPWAGIYANGGWLANNYSRPYGKGMRIAMVNGHKDKAARNYTKRDMEHLVEEHDNNVAVFSFEGGHQLAPTDAQVESLQWLMEKEEK